MTLYNVQVQVSPTDYIHEVVNEDLDKKCSLTVVYDGKKLDDPLKH